MYVSWHVGLTTPLAAATAIVDPLGAALFWTGGVLIDTDHYLDHVCVNRNWSLARAYWWHIRYGKWLMRHPEHRGLCVFHTVEVIGLVALLAAFVPALSFLLWGMLFHLFLDKIYDHQVGCFWTRAFSVVQWALWTRKSAVWVMSEERLAREEEENLIGRTATPKPEDDPADLIGMAERSP